ncbi:molybdenum cofactor synthesis domain protein [Anaeromyxobacter dehalogenans 2CP-1]|uniref:Molybdopterin molybdenumtransferase n=1 Tax=Anaeromyxobacter dehalogenans (strain ATCC BAA-258 / DSM 21875 / 2CP-1) TaxID=455488 RepID=B8J513_ANAD2|nr:molybdenum cofactor synthesis domain protein [Anaeromyxobacter dehalogenans 2CP-1]
MYKRSVLTPETARARILAALSPLAPLAGERVPLADAVGRALAEDLVPDRDLPAFDASTMDGYALRAADARRAGARLPVAFEVYAGRPAAAPLPPGSCCRIFTGAPLPAGADAVEMQEEVRRAGKAAVFRRPVAAGRFVRARGSDLAAGAVALAAGAVVDPGAVGLAAGIGRAELVVRRRPRVAILPTGDELVPPGSVPGPGELVDSNGLALAAAVREAGGEPILLRPARDEAASLSAALAAVRGADALLTSGGVSVGERDLVRAALEHAGARLDFWRVAMRPGKPFAFGLWGTTAVFGLPGNPASTLVTFELFVRPALRALAGLPGSGRVVSVGRLASAQEKPAELTVYLRCRVRHSGDELVLEPLRTQVSGNLSSTTGHAALAVLPPGRARLARGARVRAILLAPDVRHDG